LARPVLALWGVSMRQYRPYPSNGGSRWRMSLLPALLPASMLDTRRRCEIDASGLVASRMDVAPVT
jgi:hypothetical protein